MLPFVAKRDLTIFTITPSLSSTPASTAFHRSLPSPDLAAAKRTARGRGGRSTSRGRRGRPDPDDHPPSNGAASFVFAPSSNVPYDEQRERLLRRLNEISIEKRKLEQQHQSSSANGAVGITSSGPTIGVPTNPISNAADSILTSRPSSHHNAQNYDDTDNDRQRRDHIRDHDRSNDDRKGEMSSDEASRHFHHSSHKPRSSSSGMSGVPSSNARKHPPTSASAGGGAPTAPLKRRRGDHRDPAADSDAPTAGGHVDGSESPPRISSQLEHTHRNGKHIAPKPRASSSSGHGAKSSVNPAGSSPPPPPPHSQLHSHPPPPIDLDSITDPSHPSLSIPAERSRGRTASSGGRAGHGMAPAASPQSSPTLSGSRGSSRVRTPSVLLSSHPGEKSGSGGGGGAGGNSGTNQPKNRQVMFCSRLIKDLIRLKDGFAFAQPIDQLWTRDQLPGYFDVIKKPMDLGTIRNRLENGFYLKTRGKQEVEEVVFDVEAFRSDVRLVFTNAQTYNRPGDLFYESASRLLEKFDSKMKSLPSSSEAPPPSKKSKKRKKASSNAAASTTIDLVGGGPGGRNSLGSASNPIVLHDSTATGGAKSESSKKRKVSKSDLDDNGRVGRTSKKKPPIPSGMESGGRGPGGSGNKSKGSAPGGSKKKKGSSSSAARGVGNSSGSMDIKGGPSKNGNGDAEVVEVKARPKQDNMSVPDMEVRLRALKRQRSLLEAGAPASPPASSSTSYKAQAQALYHVEMTYQEKVQLSTNVGKLPADKLQRIVALATRNKSSSMQFNQNEEIELDIDSMNNETLREMEAYVNQILSKGKKKGSGSSALMTSPNADILSMTVAQVNTEIDKLIGLLRKKSKGKSKELHAENSDNNINKKNINSNSNNNSSNNKPRGGDDDGDDDDMKKKKSFYDTESSSDSDSGESGSEGSGSDSDDSSSDSDDSSDDESDGEGRRKGDDGDADAERKRRERNLAHQQAMQAAGTPLPSPGYQSSQRSS